MRALALTRSAFPSFLVQNASFSARVLAKIATSSAGKFGNWRFRELRSSGLPQRKNGFVALSEAMVVGTVGSFLRPCSTAQACFCCNAALSGSSVSAKRRFFSVYSCLK